MNNEAKFTLPNGHRRLFLVAITLVSLAGIALRLYPSSTFHGVGYDEGLYREYVNNLIASGLTSYPDFAESYVERQQKLPAAILPPTRFLYIFTGLSLASGHGRRSARRAPPCFLPVQHSPAFSPPARSPGAWAGPGIALAVLALMACAPMQLHMSQHALIDGFFAFWATLSLWFLWENLRQPNNARWLILYTANLAFMVITKENALFAYVGLLALILAKQMAAFWHGDTAASAAHFGRPSPGARHPDRSLRQRDHIPNIYRLLVSKASVLPYAIATGDGPWYRYLVDLLLASPLVFLARVGRNLSLKSGTKPALYLVMFIAATYLLDVQRPLRHESALHQHVGYAHALSRGHLPLRSDPPLRRQTTGSPWPWSFWPPSICANTTSFSCSTAFTSWSPLDCSARSRS